MIRIASYNIHNGVDVQHHMEVLGADFALLGADLVGVQEVDQFAARSGMRDTTAELAVSGGFSHAYFARAIDFQGGEYGTAVLSRYPTCSFAVTPLPSGASEQRGLGHAIVEIEGKTVHFLNTHLSLGGDDARVEQFASIAAELPSDAPWILTGDFNTESFEEFAPLGGTLVNCAERRMLSYYPDGLAIDNIVLSHHFRLRNAGMAESTHSDHYMIWCDVEL